MDAITTIDKATANLIGREVEAALREVAERHGLELVTKGGRFDPSIGTFKPNVEFKVGGSDAAEFAQWASLFGLDADDFGAEFTAQGRTFKVAGVAPRSSVRPILATEVATGKTYKFTEDAVAKALGKS